MHFERRKLIVSVCSCRLMVERASIADIDGKLAYIDALDRSK